MKKETLQNILLAPLGLTLHAVAYLPLRVLFLFSDLLYLLVYHIVRYRRHVVRRNLRNAFPQESESYRRHIERRFYRHFCDYFFETIKLLHISDKQMRRRMQFVDSELLESELNSGRSVIMMLGHYGNWEYISSISLWIDTPNARLGQIYRPLKNKWFDRLFLRIRSRFGLTCIPKANTLRDLLTVRASGKQSGTGFIADQTPSPANIHHWITFLNQDTPVLTGGETIAKKLDMAVMYFDVEKIKRGYYRATIRKIELDPRSCPDFEITDRYMALMEETIRRAPEYWLWTHNRWKHRRL